MPSLTPRQHNAMEAAAHGKSTLGIPKSVGKDFARADGDKSFTRGGPVTPPDNSEQTRNASNNDYKANRVTQPKQGPKVPLDSDWGPDKTKDYQGSFADGGAVDDAGNEDRFQASRARDKAAQAVAAPYNKGSAGVKASEPPVVKNPPWAQSASNFALGGVVPPPTMGVSSAYPPPQGHRSEGPRNYGKK